MSAKYFLPVFLITHFIGFKYSVAQTIIKDTTKADNEVCTYFTTQPKEKITGIVLLLPGRGESAKEVFKKTSLPKTLEAKNYLTVIPDLRYSLFTGITIRAQITQILKAQSIKYKLDTPRIIIGGFSAGGAVAISYAEFILSFDTVTNLKGIFVIDPPLDLERLYHSAERMLKYDCSDLIHKEGTLTKDFLDKALGGSPEVKPENYLEHSPYSANSADGGNAKWLKNIPIRLYSEPDLQFVQNNYCNELQFEDMNAFDLEKLNAFLLKMGNSKSEYIKTTGKGFHSWNIADADELTEWIIKLSARHEKEIL